MQISQRERNMRLVGVSQALLGEVHRNLRFVSVNFIGNDIHVTFAFDESSKGKVKMNFYRIKKKIAKSSFLKDVGDIIFSDILSNEKFNSVGKFGRIIYARKEC
ncbi:hypothetical protein [Parasaccharibacter apium]|uniref:hypothetical protein n=1 Tax=Parasaccharibacter apium TaxID=1510841 RepID=UPI0012EB1889|nr:hypothetical protein [Parasaccharibacter apium]